MVYFMENAINQWMIEGYHPFWETTIYIYMDIWIYIYIYIHISIYIYICLHPEKRDRIGGFSISSNVHWGSI